MQSWLLPLLQRVVHPRITRCNSLLIKISSSPARVYRLQIDDMAGDAGAATFILKVIAPEWPDDPAGADREWRFYSALHPRLALSRPHIWFAGIEPICGQRVVLMEDIGPDYRFFAPQHRWTEPEARCLLRAYARLHSHGERCLPAADQRDWLYRISLFAMPWRTTDLAALAHDLASKGVWPPLPRLEHLIRTVFAALPAFTAGPATLLHNDVTPANAALPHDLSRGEAILYDWEMVGWGRAELDLAFLFTQPFGSERNLPKQAVLAYYWQQRYLLDGIRPSAEECEAAQRQAEALWALSLIPVAHRMASHPHPPDSAPALYWRSMHPVVAARLQYLISEI